MDQPEGQRFGLAPLHLADKERLDRFFAWLDHPLSDHSFANVFIWGASLRLYWQQVHRHLCVFANGAELTMLLPPLPEPSAGADDLARCLGHCFEVMDAYNQAAGQPRHLARLEYACDPLAARLTAGVAATGMDLVASPMSGDYLYDMARMIDLAGGALKSKRYGRSKFMREHPGHRTAPLEESHVPACLELLSKWQSDADADHAGEFTTDNAVATADLRRREVLACQRALAHWRQLDLTGMVLLVDERVIGFTLGQPMSPTQVSILIEKTHPDYHGAPQFIFSEFCRLYWSGYRQCNVGDDWGIPGLRFTKESYRPIARLGKHTLRRRADHEALQAAMPGATNEPYAVAAGPATTWSLSTPSRLAPAPGLVSVAAALGLTPTPASDTPQSAPLAPQLVGPQP